MDEIHNATILKFDSNMETSSFVFIVYFLKKGNKRILCGVTSEVKKKNGKKSSGVLL